MFMLFAVFLFDTNICSNDLATHTAQPETRVEEREHPESALRNAPDEFLPNDISLHS